MTDKRHLLKINLKSLAAEARIIRKAEAKLQLPPWRIKADKDPPPHLSKYWEELRTQRKLQRAKARESSWYEENRRQLNELQHHRRVPLRAESRATHLAYGFLRGKTLQQLEGNRQWISLEFESVRHAIRYFRDRPVYEAAIDKIAMYGGLNNKERLERQVDFQKWLLDGGITPPYVPETLQAREERKMKEKKDYIEAVVHHRITQLQSPDRTPVR